jgi:hypothetical protein
MDSSVRFEGIGPFHLPVAQDASATGRLDNGVTVTLRRGQGVERGKRADQCRRCTEAL